MPDHRPRREGSPFVTGSELGSAVLPYINRQLGTCPGIRSSDFRKRIYWYTWLLYTFGYPVKAVPRFVRLGVVIADVFGVLSEEI